MALEEADWLKVFKEREDLNMLVGIEEGRGIPAGERHVVQPKWRAGFGKKTLGFPGRRGKGKLGIHNTEACSLGQSHWEAIIFPGKVTDKAIRRSDRLVSRS